MAPPIHRAFANQRRGEACWTHHVASAVTWPTVPTEVSAARNDASGRGCPARGRTTRSTVLGGNWSTLA